jgi:hypothetical protein
MSERMPVLTAAMSVALSARTDQLTMHAVDDMRTKAEELLAKGDGLRSAIIAFATAYEADRRDKAAMAAHGVALQAALELALPGVERPAMGAALHHPWMDRKDVNG